MKINFAVTTVSWIRTENEGRIVLEGLKYLSSLIIPIVVVDKGSPEKYKRDIKILPNVIFIEEPSSLTQQLIISHRQAAKYADYLFYLHTDKLDFIINNVTLMLNKYQNLKEKGLLIPSRSNKSFSTYLPYQRASEEFLNFFMSTYVGIKEDYYSGPKIYPAFLVKYLDQINDDLGWGIEGYFYAIAKRLKLPFVFTSADFSAPLDIENVEESEKYRLEIVKWQIEGFLQGQNIKL